MKQEPGAVADFLLQFDALKSVNRRTYISGGLRVENSAEHSWHLAMSCWAFAEWLDEDYDVTRLMQLALVHDLGEIGAGDTFLYSADRGDAHIAERASVAELAAHKANPLSDLVQLWEEQEWGDSKEARLLKVIDRLLPFLHNVTSEGKAWQDNNIKKSQVLAMHGFIADENARLYEWMLGQVDHAVEQGWLIDG